MMDDNDILKYFSEERDDKQARQTDGRDAGLSGPEFDLVSTIWEESGNVGNYRKVNTDAAWEQMMGKVESKRKGRVVRMRYYTVAAAASLIILVFATRFLMTSAEVPLVAETPEKQFESYIDAVNYAEANLFEIAEEVMASARSHQFEQRVIEMAGERFDGETNVLIADVLGPEATSDKWFTRLSAFYNIEGANYHPQIYIPDYDDYQEKSSDPLVVIHVDDELKNDSSYIYDSFRADKRGRLQFAGRVSEEDIDNERIWVFSLNENVDSDMRLVNSMASIFPKEGRKNGRIDQLQVMSPKESWAGGGSEVHIRANLQYWDGVNVRGMAMDVPCDRSSSTGRGIPVRRFSRDEIERGELVEVDYHLHDNWDVDDFLQDEVAYAFVLFEADVWPSSEREAGFVLPNGDARSLMYASAQDYYDVDVVFGTSSPEGWNSPAYPEGIPASMLIDSFRKEGNAEIFYTTEIY